MQSAGMPLTEVQLLKDTRIWIGMAIELLAVPRSVGNGIT